MDPNIITIDSDDSNDTTLLPLKNNQSPLVIVHRVINTNVSNNQNNSINFDMVKHCSVNQQPLQNNNHFHLNPPKNPEIIPHKNELKQRTKSILETQLTKCTEIIDVENYKNGQFPKTLNSIPMSKGRTSHSDEILSVNSFNKNRNNLVLKNQTFHNKDVINVCSGNEPVRPPGTFVTNCASNSGGGLLSNNSEILQFQVSENRNMNPSQTYEQHSFAWSHHNTNFMKQPVNSVIQSNKLVLLQNPPTAHQSSIPRHHLSNNQEFLQKNMYKSTEIRNVQSLYHSPAYSCMNNSNYFQPGYYNNGIMMNSYVPNNNFWMRVKVEEIPEGDEVVAQYFYNNETQTPVTIENHFQVNAIASNSNQQFIDISALPNITSVQTNDNILNGTINNNSQDEKNNEMCTPPLLQQKNSIISCGNNANTNIDNAGDKDVIYIGEFKNNSTTDSINQCTEGTELTKTKNSISINMKRDETKQSKKKFRKNYDTIEPRRNPKRQVQVNKEFSKLIDDILWKDVEKEIKKKKATSNKERVDKKPARISPRIQQTNCGAVYSPPSPLSADHLRRWPTEGMHEKPVYNPQTGEIEPFDYVTRNIAKNYNTKTSSKRKRTENETTEDVNKKSNKGDSLNVLSHEMLHHMISYVATVIQMKNSTTKEENKIHFLNDLGLTTNDDALVGKNCDNVKDVFKDILHAKDNNKNSDKHNLKELLKHAMLMYCITNDVSQSDLVKYIDSLKPEDINSISNEQFGISNESLS